MQRDFIASKRAYSKNKDKLIYLVGRKQIIPFKVGSPLKLIFQTYLLNAFLLINATGLIKNRNVCCGVQYRSATFAIVLDKNVAFI